MSSSYTSSNKFEKPATGEQSGTWGETIDTNYDLIDQSLDGYASIAIPSGSSTLALSLTNGQSSAARSRSLVFTGTPSGSVTVQIVQNAVPRWWFVYNNTAQSLVFVGAGSTQATVPASGVTIILSDGANGVYDLLNVAGHTTSIGTLKALNSINSPSYTGGAATLTGALSAQTIAAIAGLSAATITAAGLITAPTITATDVTATNLNITNAFTPPNIVTPGSILAKTIAAQASSVPSIVTGAGAPSGALANVSGGIMRGKITIENAGAFSTVGAASSPIVTAKLFLPTSAINSNFAVLITPGNAASAALYGPGSVYVTTDPTQGAFTLMSGATPLQGASGIPVGTPLYTWYYVVIF